jgi:CheY-like chemotaxis protein
MPREDGYALIARVRALPATGGGLTRTAAVTGLASDADRVRLLRAGFDRHLPLPVAPDDLVALVANLAASSRSTREEF